MLHFDNSNILVMKISLFTPDIWYLQKTMKIHYLQKLQLIYGIYL